MVIQASGMVRGRVRLATICAPTWQPFVFRGLHCRSYTINSQQSTVFAEETVWKTFLFALFIAFLEEKFSSYKFLSIFGGGHKHKAECLFFICKELLSCFWRRFKTIIIN